MLMILNKMFIWNIEQAIESKLDEEWVSYALGNNNTSEITLLMYSAIKNDDIAKYKFIVENYGLRKYNKNILDFDNFREQHQANLDHLKYLSPYPKDIEAYLKNYLS